MEIVHVYLLEKQQQWELTNQKKKKNTQNFHRKCLMVGFLYYNINYVLSFILLLFFFDSLNWILFFSSRSFYAKKRNLRNKLWDAGLRREKPKNRSLCCVVFHSSGCRNECVSLLHTVRFIPKWDAVAASKITGHQTALDTPTGAFISPYWKLSHV